MNQELVPLFFSNSRYFCDIARSRSLDTDHCQAWPVSRRNSSCWLSPHRVARIQTPSGLCPISSVNIPASRYAAVRPLSTSRKKTPFIQSMLSPSSNVRCSKAPGAGSMSSASGAGTVGVAVGVGVTVEAGEDADVGTAVGVGVGVAADVGVGGTVGVAVGSGTAVATTVGVATGVAVAAGASVGAGASAPPQASASSATSASVATHALRSMPRA